MNMIGFRFIFDARLLILYRELITKVMWFDDRHKIQDKISVLFNYYNDTRFKINPSFVLNCLKYLISVLFVGGRLGDASAKLIKSVTGVSEQSRQRHE